MNEINEDFYIANPNQDYIALCDLLKATAVCLSGGEAKQKIAAGDVWVDGVQEFRKTNKIRHGMVVSGAGFEIRVFKAWVIPS
jgi:ribosome-associated protein